MQAKKKKKMIPQIIGDYWRKNTHKCLDMSE